MTRIRTLLLGVSLASLSSAAFAQTAVGTTEEIALLRAQVQALSTRLNQLEAAQSTAVTAPAAAPSAIPSTVVPLSTNASAQSASAPIAATDWSTGMPEFRSPDGTFTFRPRARLVADASTTTGSRFGNRNLTGTELRSLRLGAQGKLGGGFTYWVEADFADNTVVLKNAFLAHTRKVGGRDVELSFGQRLNDRGVEGTTGDDQTPLLERNFANTVTGPERGSFGIGAMARVYAETWHASVSLTGDDISTGTTSDSMTLAARAHWSPLKTERDALHLGVWGYLEDVADGVTAIRRNTVVSPRINDNLRLASGDYLDPDRSRAVGVELGGTHGPAWVMFEAGRRTIELAAGSEYDQDGTSISGGFFLTGEKPPLSARTGSWQRPRVLKPFGTGGYGAVEVVGRYDTADFTDSPTGGDAETLAVGVNWYPTMQTRVSFQLSDWTVNNRTGGFVGEDDGQSATARVQVGF